METDQEIDYSANVIWSESKGNIVHAYIQPLAIATPPVITSPPVIVVHALEISKNVEYSYLRNNPAAWAAMMLPGAL